MYNQDWESVVNEPGIQDATVLDFLLPLLSLPGMSKVAAKAPDVAESTYGVLKGLGNAGEVGLGRPTAASAISKGLKEGLESVKVFIKGIQKGVNGAEEELYGVTGPAKVLKKWFGDEAPASVPKSTLEKLGLLPKQVAESQNPTAPFASDLRELWANAAMEQSGTPTRMTAPYVRPDAFLAKGQ